jgi:hypothetical protein
VLASSNGRLNARLLVFSLDLGLSFAILVLYISFVEALVLVLVLITATIVAASREDLTEFRSDTTMIAVAVGFAIVVFLTAAYASPAFSTNLFYILVLANFGLLALYSILRVAHRSHR